MKNYEWLEAIGNDPQQQQQQLKNNKTVLKLTKKRKSNKIFVKRTVKKMLKRKNA